jgi:hypothetical protein
VNYLIDLSYFQKNLILITTILLMSSFILAEGSYSQYLGDGETRKKAWSDYWDGCDTATISCTSNEFLVGEEKKGSTGEYSAYECRPQWYQNFSSYDSCTSKKLNDDWLNLSKERGWESGTQGGSVSKTQCGADSGGGPEVKEGVAAYCVNPSVAPSLSSPSDGAKAVKSSVTLQAQFNDPTGESGTVKFYNASNDNLIGSCSASNGTSCSITWSDLSKGTYTWYTKGNDSTSISDKSSTWSFKKEKILSIENENTDPLDPVLNMSTAEKVDSVKFLNSSGKEIAVVSNPSSSNQVSISELQPDRRYSLDAKVFVDGNLERTIDFNITTLDTNVALKKDSKGAEKYIFYRSFDRDGQYNKIGESKDKDFRDGSKALKIGLNPCYRVTAVNKTGGETEMSAPVCLGEGLEVKNK